MFDSAQVKRISGADRRRASGDLCDRLVIRLPAPAQPIRGRLDEPGLKSWLRDAGVSVPPGRLVSDAVDAAVRIQGNGWMGDATKQAAALQTVLAANPDLKPEKADTYTVGFAVTPLQGLEATLDLVEATLATGARVIAHSAMP